MSNHRGEDVLCLLCDYWHICLGILIMALIGWFRLRSVQTTIPITVETPDRIEFSTLEVPTAISTSISLPAFTIMPALPSATSSALPSEKPEFVIAVIPVKWTDSDEAFDQNARRQIDFFIRASGIDNYFQISVEVFDHGLNNVSLLDDQLVDKVIEFGLNTTPANRYIGLSNGDIVLDGSSDIVGWTYGPDASGIVVESIGTEISAHELGHTFGLCDEYNYLVWKEQDEAFIGGCPNPYPSECERVESLDIMCPGSPTVAGLNSIMGPSGLIGQYGFNSPSFEHLQEVFKMYSEE